MTKQEHQWKAAGIKYASIANVKRRKREQKGCCAICQQPSTLVLDHNHSTGRIRGLLCRRCNLELGMLEKFLANPEWTDAAVKYLAAAKEKRDTLIFRKWVEFPPKSSAINKLHDSNSIHEKSGAVLRC